MPADCCCQAGTVWRTTLTLRRACTDKLCVTASESVQIEAETRDVDTREDKLVVTADGQKNQPAVASTYLQAGSPDWISVTGTEVTVQLPQ